MDKKDDIRGDHEATGMFYGGAVIIGMAVGMLAGYIISGGRAEFLEGGWLDVVLGAVFGCLFGVGLGLVIHGGLIVEKRKREGTRGTATEEE